MLRKYIAFGVAAVAAAMLATSALADFETQQYYNNSNGLAGNTIKTSGWNYWQTNRVWRPASIDVAHCAALWFNNNQGVYYIGYDDDCVTNPFAIHSSQGYSQGECWNQESYTVAPWTCQVYNWNA